MGSKAFKTQTHTKDCKETGTFKNLFAGPSHHSLLHIALPEYTFAE